MSMINEQLQVMCIPLYRKTMIFSSSFASFTTRMVSIFLYSHSLEGTNTTYYIVGIQCKEKDVVIHIS